MKTDILLNERSHIFVAIVLIGPRPISFGIKRRHTIHMSEDSVIHHNYPEIVFEE